MSELIEKILTDTSARDCADLSVLASSVTENFLPWGDE